MAAVRLTAGWVLPIDQQPIRNGAVLTGPNGRIVEVGPDAAVARPEGVPARDFRDAAIVPGLVNVHTHLELTAFAGQVEQNDFAAWIRRLRELKDQCAPDAYLAAARRGLADSWATGVTTIADTGDRGAVIRALAECGGSGVVYQEVFGPHPDQARSSLDGLRTTVAELRRFESSRLRLGVSPHAPYTVSGPLYRMVGELARSEGLPLAVHHPESRAETQLLRAAEGPFAEAWQRRGIPLPSLPGRSPVAWLDEHGVLSDRTLCIHVVQVDAEDVARLAAKGAAIAHCPLSNRSHGHGDAPLGALLAAGLRIGVGTDSLVSVRQLDLLAEARAARTLAGLSAEWALALVTLEGARAIGLADEVGSLTSGKWGDVAIVRLRGANGTPAEQVLATGAEDIVATYVGGRLVFGGHPA
jgi:cytosine/adenosine deaminase-related metal-dependent hydrolase